MPVRSWRCPQEPGPPQEFGAGAGAAAGAGAIAGLPGLYTRTGAGLLTITGTEDGPSCDGVSEGISIVDGRLTTVDGVLAAVDSGWEFEFISMTPPNATAPTTARPAIISRPLVAAADYATGACTGMGWGTGA